MTDEEQTASDDLLAKADGITDQITARQKADEKAKPDAQKALDKAKKDLETIRGFEAKDRAEF